MIAKTRNIDPRLAAARGRAAVANREVKAGRRAPEELPAIQEELRRTVIEVNFERAASEIQLEMSGGNLTADTYRSIVELHAQATKLAREKGLVA